MRVGTNAPAWVTVGALIAIVVLVLAVVFMAIGQLDFKVGLLIAGLAVARLT